MLNALKKKKKHLQLSSQAHCSSVICYSRGEAEEFFWCWVVVFQTAGARIDAWKPSWDGQNLQYGTHVIQLKPVWLILWWLSPGVMLKFLNTCWHLSNQYWKDAFYLLTSLFLIIATFVFLKCQEQWPSLVTFDLRTPNLDLKSCD